MTIDELIAAWPHDPEKKTARMAFADDVGVSYETARFWHRRGQVPRVFRFAVSEAARVNGVMTKDGKPVTVEVLYAMAGETLPRAAIVEKGAA